MISYDKVMRFFPKSTKTGYHQQHAKLINVSQLSSLIFLYEILMIRFYIEKN